MHVSAVIASYLIDDGKIGLLKQCTESLVGFDELIVLAHYGLGFCEAWNTAVKMSTGTHVVLIGDATRLVKGSVRCLAENDMVVFPSGAFKRVFAFGMPKEIALKYGPYDMVYNDGIHYMDEDLLKRFERDGVKMIEKQSVAFDHPQGGRTVNNIPEFHIKVQKNIEIYAARWGGKA